MRVALPYDVWCLIASFVPKSALLNLYSVNSAFFDIVMNDQYREVSIYHTGDENTRRCLMNMSPVVAKRVQTLILRPHLLPKPLSVSVANQLRNYVQLACKPKNSAASQTLLRHISMMTEVTSLTIGCYPSDGVQLFRLTASSFVHTAWSAHGHRLRSLSLAIPLEAYPIVLSSAPVLDSLEELGITLRTAFANTEYHNILPLIAAFINHHSRSLNSISVDTPDAMVDPFLLFSNLHQLPHLNKFSICHSLDRLRPHCPTGIESFLIQHAALLREFTVHFVGPYGFVNNIVPSPDEFFSHPILQIKFPRLTSLDLGLCQWAKTHKESVEGNLVKYLRPLRGSLARLAVRDYVLTFPEMAALVTVFSSSESQLRSLEMHMYFLSCDLLDLLSRQLTELHHLKLHFHSLTKQDDGTRNASYKSYSSYYDTRAQNQASDFLRGMADRRYSAWTLRHLTIQPLYHCLGRWTECRTLLAAALPSVITFNGLSGEEFSSIPDFTTWL